MRNRKNLETQREAIAARFNASVSAPPGPSRDSSPYDSTAHRAVADDPTLAARLDAALRTGMALPDLADVPRYRQAATVEDAIAAHEATTAGGPCDFCGSMKGRIGAGPFGYMEEPQPGFRTTRDGRTACFACSDVLREHGENALRVRAFLAAASCRAPGLANPPGVRFAHELGTSSVEPWAHVDRAEARATALRLFHPRSFCLTPADAQRVSMPGLPAQPWDPADLPKPEPKVFQHETPAAKDARLWWERRKEARAAERARKEANRERHLAALAKRDAAFDAMTPDEQAAELARREADKPLRMDQYAEPVF